MPEAILVEQTNSGTPEGETMKPMIGILGCGMMGSAMARYLMNRRGIPKENLLFTNIPDAVPIVEKDLGINPAATNKELVEKCDVIFMSVKPQSFPDIAKEISPMKKPVISIMAGVRIGQITKALGSWNVARMMPSLAVRAGYLIGGFAVSESADEHAREMFNSLLGAEPHMFEMPEERLDWVTALSGSGPGFFAALADSFIKSADDSGLPAEQRRVLVLATMMATGKLLLDESRDPATLMKQVASPGGTTEAGLKVLKDAEDTLREVIRAAARRGKELSDLMESDAGKRSE